MANPRCHNFDDDFILSGFPKRHVFNGPFALGERPSRDESLRLHYLIPSSTSMRNWTLWKPWRVSLDKSSGVLLLRGILRSRSLRPVACDCGSGVEPYLRLCSRVEQVRGCPLSAPSARCAWIRTSFSAWAISKSASNPTGNLTRLFLGNSDDPEAGLTFAKMFFEYDARIDCLISPVRG